MQKAKNSIIHIDCPKKTSKVYISIAFDYGYINENDTDFGLSHLVEHVLYGALRRKFDFEEVDGYVDDEHVVLDITATKKQYEEFILDNGFENFLEQLAESLDLEMIENEKNRILIELDEKYSTIFNQISQRVFAQVVTSPKKLARMRLDQSKNIKRFTKTDVVRGIKKLMVAQKLIFVSYFKNKSNFKKFNHSGYSEDFTPRFIKNKKIKIKPLHSVVPDMKVKILVFESLSLQDSLISGMALDFLVKKIRSAFEERMEDFGMYQVDYEHILEKKYGLVWFILRSYKKIPIEVMDIFWEERDKFLSSKKLSQDLKKLKSNVLKNMKEDWKDNEERHQWVINDIFNYGKVVGYEEMVKVMNGIKVEDVHKIGLEILHPDKLWVLES